MQQAPPKTGDSPWVRGPGGRFAPGNSGGNGRKPGSAQQDLRQALRDSVSADDIADIVRALCLKAKDGDVAAAKELFDRLFGKSAMVLDPETAQGIVMNLIARGNN